MWTRKSWNKTSQSFQLEKRTFKKISISPRISNSNIFLLFLGHLQEMENRISFSWCNLQESQFLARNCIKAEISHQKSTFLGISNFLVPKVFNFIFCNKNTHQKFLIKKIFFLLQEMVTRIKEFKEFSSFFIHQEKEISGQNTSNSWRLISKNWQFSGKNSPILARETICMFGHCRS